MTFLNHYNNLKKQLSDIATSRIALGELVVKLGSFVGESESVKKAVKNAIIACFDTNPHLKNDLKDVYSSHVTKLSESVKSAVQAVDTDEIEKLKQKITPEIQTLNDQLNKQNNLNNVYSSSPSSSAESDKLHSKLEALEKVKELCEFLTNLNNQQNDPKKLLDNLCTGLEKFLGFDPTSKGYNGEGIVYSDLDRLCDGVMGFLSGVLSNIKEHLGQHKDTLDDAINTLEKNKHAGKKGFNAAIEKVAERVGRYNDGVMKSNDSVKTVITKMSENMAHLKTEVSQILNDNAAAGNSDKVREAVSLVNGDLQACKKYVDIFVTLMNKNKHNIIDLNNDCRINVDHANKNIAHETKRLYALSDKAMKDLIRTEMEYKDTLESCRKTINLVVETQVHRLVEELKRKFKGINDKILEVHRKLKGYVRRLDIWMNETKWFLDRPMGKVEHIVTNDVGKKKLESILEKTGNLKSMAQKHTENFNNAKSHVERMLKEIKKNVAELEIALKEDLKGLRDGIKTSISEYVRAVKEHFSQIKEKVGEAKVGESSGKGLIKHWEELKNGIDSIVTEVAGPGQGLSTIVSGVSAYITDFKFNFENSILKTWLTDIFKAEPVFTHIQNYVRGSRSSADQVLHVFLTQFGRQIAEVGRVAHLPKITTNLEEKLNYIHQFLTQFAQQLNVVNVSSITGTIQAQFKMRSTQRSSSSMYDETHLQNAVKAIIGILQSTAKSVAEEFVKLRTQSNIKNVNLAITKLNKLNDHFSITAKDQLGYRIATTLGETKQKIDQLGTVLNTDLQKQVGDQIGNDEPFSSNQVTLDKLTTYGNGHKGKKKELNDSLTSISNVVNGLSVDVTEGVLTDFSNQIAEEVDALVEAFSKIGGHLSSDLTHLKDIYIDEKLIEIRNGLNDLRSGPMTQVLNSFVDYFAFVDKLTLNIISEIHGTVDNEIKDALSTLTTAARRNYITSIKTLLTAFADKVEKELAELPEEIERDLTIGFKGLMKTLEDGSTDKNETEKSNIKKFSNLVTELTGPNVDTKKAFVKLADAYQDFFRPLKNYMVGEIQNVNDENNKKKNPKGTDQQPYSSELLKVYESLCDLLDHIANQQRYDYKVPGLLEKLTSAINGLKPENFATPNSPVIDGIREGLGKFVDELRKVYINVYDGNPDPIDFGQLVITEEARAPRDGESGKLAKQVLTPTGERLAKVCLTLFEILINDFEKLCKVSNNNKDKQIYLEEENRLGVFLKVRGYNVAKGADSQDGELQNKSEMDGQKIRELCEYTMRLRHGGEYNPATGKVEPIEGGLTTLDRFFGYLYDVLTKYRTVCHLKLIPKPRTPTTINQMLHWVDGLPYTTVYNELTIHAFGELFEKPEEDETTTDESGPPLKLEDDDKLEAYPETITAVNVRETLTEVCRFSDRVLVCILGHGQADGRYACDFSTNPDGLLYPSNASACLDMLVDILKRIYEQFYFLFIQCSRDKEHVSWRDCWYGRHVGGSDWRCNEKQCINQMGNQSPDQKANQTCGQTRDRHPSCGLKSPLQSFLEDGLPGFLPHSLKKPGCKLECTVSNHGGLPCKTPMGFGDIRLTASRASRGERMINVLEYLCGRQDSPLTKLCGYFNCLLQMPPQTLGDMFAFYYNFLNECCNGNAKRMKHRELAYADAVKNANFKRDDTRLDVTAMFKNFSHESAPQSTHIKGDLLCLVRCDHGTNSQITCGRYLQSFGMNTWTVFSKEHADKYVSWVVYLTETFYKLLKQLYEECCNNCNKPGTKCYGKICVKDCKVKSYYKSQESASEAKKVIATSTKQSHDKQCQSISQCPYTRPTLSKYGFVLGSPYNLSGAYDVEIKRTCHDFCKTLERVLSDEKNRNDVLAKLVHETIPNFLWKIRQPFSYLVLALWLLSLLYLTHIMVIRLDLLHIKSHLHSPSSHRIAAQSLLAAGRVNKLNRVFYLQP